MRAARRRSSDLGRSERRRPFSSDLPVMQVPQVWSEKFGLSGSVFLKETVVARLWQVTWQRREAVLKLYRCESLFDEGPGLVLLQAWNGRGAVRPLAQEGPAVLLEWLPGRTLGDLARGANLQTADRALIDLAASLPSVEIPDLTDLETRCSSLNTFEPTADCPYGLARDLLFASAVARHLLATTTSRKSLHGDLHHDNILRGPSGWTAIDPKGVYGDPSYEIANAFRNPVGAAELLRDRTRSMRLATDGADALGVPRQRILGWAFVHCALSIVWDAGPQVSGHPDADVLGMLRTLFEADQA